MPEAHAYYLAPYDQKWQLKRVGGVKVIRTFPDKAAALAFAQVMISKQKAQFRVQNPDGTWQAM